MDRLTGAAAVGIALTTALGQASVDPASMLPGLVKDGPAWILVGVLLWNLFVSQKTAADAKGKEDDRRHGELMAQLKEMAKRHDNVLKLIYEKGK